MKFNELFDLVESSPNLWQMYPVNSFWWIIIPTEMIKGNTPPVNYLPKYFTKYLSQLNNTESLVRSFNQNFREISSTSKVPTDCVMLASGKTNSYVTFGSTMNVSINDELKRFDISWIADVYKTKQEKLN